VPAEQARGLVAAPEAPRRNKAAKLRQAKLIAFAIHELWSMDFAADELFDGPGCACSRPATAARASA